MKPYKEIAELRECIEVIDFNIDRIAAGEDVQYFYSQQMELKSQHLARIKELESANTNPNSAEKEQP